MRPYAFLAAAAVSALVVAPDPARATDQGDAPGARLDGRLDLGDLYVFTAPGNTAHTVMIATVSPLAGWTGASSFAAKATYNICVDLNGDGVEDDVHTFTFKDPAADGSQAVTVSHRGRGGKYKTKGTVGAEFMAANGTRVQAGLFDEPAFFDWRGLRAGNAYSPATSRNFFAGMNTLALVVEVSNGEFGPYESFRAWATTALGKKQVDRVGRPLVSALLLAPLRRDAFNAARTKDDVTNFSSDLTNRLVLLRGGNYTGVSDLVASLLPDVLPFTPGTTTGFAAGNGRKLDDDVVDMQLATFTANGVTTDHVVNDSAFLATFPYLAPANP